MSDSWEESTETPSLNVTASEWKPSATASEWKPSWLPSGDAGASAAAPAAAAAPAPAPVAEKAVEEAAEEAVEKVAEEAAPVVEEPVENVAEKVEKVAITEKVDMSGFEKEVEEQLASIEGVDKREHLNVVFIGHVDAGKSTLSGSILYLMGTVDKRTIEKFEQEAKDRNRESWFLAYIMDTNEEERAKGKTVEVGRAYIETEERRITILDAPGHKNYVPAMISGASQADVGILVISARKGEFEAGFEGLGQTREHAMLAKTLGVQKLIIVINKMDEQTVKWNQDRYDMICKKLRPFLKGCGYKIKKDVIFLPISALSGVNVKDPVTSETCDWATKVNGGKSLMQTLDDLTIVGRDAEKALRMTVIDRYVERGVVLMAKVEQGVCYVGQTILLCPNQMPCKVESIFINEVEVQGAKPGENVLVRLSGVSENEVSKGHVVASKYFPVRGCTEIIAQVYLIGLLEHRPLFSAGYNAIFHAHTAEEECTAYELVALLDKTGKIAKKNPPFAKSGSTVICKIRLEKSICLEPYEKMMQLGRFTLRDEGKTIAIGIIKRCR